MPPPTQGTPLFLVGLGLLDGRDGIGAADRIPQRHPLGELVPAGWPPAMSAIRLAMARQVIFEAVEVQARLQDAVGEQVVQARSARWMIRAGSEATALVAFWITLLMIVWKPLVMPLSWFCRVVVMLMSPQIRLLFPADPDADALHVAGTTHRHGPAAADAVEHVVADHAAADVHPLGSMRVCAQATPTTSVMPPRAAWPAGGDFARRRKSGEGGVHRGFLT